VEESRLLEGLNGPQREAVSHGDGPLLVLAGAGSGKTRGVTRRVACLLGRGVRAHEVLALTFTNKAAGEMGERVAQLVGHSNVWMSTFHSFSARMLRRYATRLGYTANYTIYDTDDRLRLIKEILNELELDQKNWVPSKMESAISMAKSEMMGPKEYVEKNPDFYGKTVGRVYERYEARMLAASAMDFDDLLVKMVKLIREDHEVADELAKRFRYVLVDEYQDTNAAQYEIVRALVRDSRNLHVTGDPDQSIYGWRGADIGNILTFEEDYPDARVIKLEQNYRSTQTILDAAHGVIVNNTQRKDKRLWTEKAGGAKIAVEILEDEASEANWVAETIEKLLREGTPARDLAVFYRVNALSRELERGLLERHIAYSLVAGTAFYDRKEVRDVLAYLKVLVNPADDVSLLRIINVPTRGIGKTTVDALKTLAQENRLSMYEACRRVDEIDGLARRAREMVRTFVGMLDELRAHVDEPADDYLKRVLERIRYMECLKGDVKEEERRENIEELVNAAGILVEAYPEATAEEFLEQSALVSDVDALDEKRETVSLMTLHAAKGLEFKVVFIVGMEEGLLPHGRIQEGDDDLEEERRLCYVGFTRAEEKLLLSYTRTRMQYGVRAPGVPSRFLAEIPSECVERPKPTTGTVKREDTRWTHEEDESQVEELQEGDRVEHPTYGRGKVQDVMGSGAKARVRVTFGGGVTKTFILDHAPLVRL